MKNRIDHLVATKSEKAFEKKLSSLANEANADDNLKKELQSEFLQSISDRRGKISELKKELTIREQLNEVSEIVNLSHLSKKYFNKTRQWLYQRINGNTINGKPARFTDKEKDTLNFALKDISKKIGSLSIK